MCGTNDLKEDMDNEEERILDIYKRYKGKLQAIRDINPKCRLFVCPVLPSRDRSLTLKINIFNKYLFHDLQNSNLCVNIVEGFNVFADHGVLKTELHDKRTAGDILHINEKGCSILVKLIKKSIFSIKEHRNRHMTGRLFSHVVRPRY